MSTVLDARAESSMDFQAFLAWSARAARIADVERLCEMRIGRSFSHLRPDPPISSPLVRRHRCDMVRLWCSLRGIPPRRARNTLACEGVRHALGIIFARLAEEAITVALPSDVYPVYWKLAANAGLHTRSFLTFPQFELQKTLDELGDDVRVVLLPQPLKLHGRFLSEGEVAVAEEWLSKERERRLILDAVYTMGAPFDPLMHRLLQSERVILLDSLSKGWLHEHTFGVAVLPDPDVGLYSGAFRALAPSLDKLSVAHDLLTRWAELPGRIAHELDRRRERLIGRLSALKLRTLPVHRGYLIPVEADATELLAQHSLLTIPASVFGSALTQWSIASVLPPCGDAP